MRDQIFNTVTKNVICTLSLYVTECYQLLVGLQHLSSLSVKKDKPIPGKRLCLI